MRFWESLGYVVKLSDKPARYCPTDTLIEILYTFGCLERIECDSITACGLIGTRECPFLVGYGGDDNRDTDG